MGVEQIIVADTYNYDRTVEQLREAIEFEGPALVVARRPCQLFPKKQRHETHYVVIEEECTACAQCFRIGCPAIYDSGKRNPKGLAIAAIDPDQCTACSLCEQVCKFDAIVPASQVENEEGVPA
jgi:indolepyruvate ferredoxin oxidoreductase alpha subunit